MAVPNLKMNDGHHIPQVALGLWQIGDEQECVDAVKWALETGYTHFDSAQYYGNEQYLGKAVRDAGIEREKLFITTKIKNENFDEDKVIPSLDESLEKLQMDYVDLLLLHFPVSGLRKGAWKKMEEISKSGKAKSIGVSNYTIRHLEELLANCEIKPAVNQVELHVYLQQSELLAYCKQKDILVEAYSPLAHNWGMDNATLAEIGKKYGKTPAQIMLRWCVEVGTVPLPKSTHKQRIEENFAIFDFSLDAGDMEKLAALDKNHRTAWDPSDVE